MLWLRFLCVHLLCGFTPFLFVICGSAYAQTVKPLPRFTNANTTVLKHTSDGSELMLIAVHQKRLYKSTPLGDTKKRFVLGADERQAVVLSTTIGGAGEVRVYSLPMLTPVRSVELWPTSMARQRVGITNNGRWVTRSGKGVGKVEVFDTKSGQLVQAVPSQTTMAAHLNADEQGRYAAIGDWGGGLVEVVDVKTKSVHLAANNNGVRFTKHPSFSKDAKFLAFWNVGSQSRVEIWDMETKSLKHRLDTKIHGESIAFHPDGKSLLVHDAAILHVIDIETGTTRRAWATGPGKSNKLARLAISADGKSLATVGNDQTIRVWEFQTGKLIHQFQVLRPNRTDRLFILDLCFDDRGGLLAIPMAAP